MPQGPEILATSPASEIVGFPRSPLSGQQFWPDLFLGQPFCLKMAQQRGWPRSGPRNVPVITKQYIRPLRPPRAEQMQDE